MRIFPSSETITRRRFPTMCRIWQNGFLWFVMRTGWWGRCACAMNRIVYHLCGFLSAPHYQSLGLGSRLLQHACRDLSDKPVICTPLPFEKPSLLPSRRDLTTFPCMNSTGPSLLLSPAARTGLPDRAAGASGEGACFQLRSYWGLVSRWILPGDSSSPSRFSLSQA